MRTLGGVKLLILDDGGLEPLGPEQRRYLLEIVEHRYGRGSTLVTSQVPLHRWHDLIGDPTLADAILDRIVYSAHRIQLRGNFLRRKKAQEKVMAAPRSPHHGDIHQAHGRRHPGRLRRNAQTARNPRQKVLRENIFGSRQVLDSC
jgi:hypothetical protein